MKDNIFCVIFVLIMLLGLSACGEDSPATDEPNSSSIEDSANIDSNEPEAPKEAEKSENPEPVSGGKMEQAGTLGNFDVAIKGAQLAEDYEGNPAIIITYSWTNNSEETTSVMVSMIEKAFQDGLELDTAIIVDSDIYDSDITMKDVRPGTTIDTQCAYVLTSDTAVVEFEISEFLSFSDDLVVMNFDPSTL